MTTLVVHESHWGNTRQVAQAVAAALPGEVTCVDVRRAPVELPADVDLLVVGGPTHAFSMTRASTRHDARDKGAEEGHEDRGIREWLGALTPDDHRAVAVFDTRVAKARRLPGSAARAAARVVRHRRLGRLVAQESFYVDDLAGPLLDGELDRARAWGASLPVKV
jgi:hypothetical protein